MQKHDNNLRTSTHSETDNHPTPKPSVDWFLFYRVSAKVLSIGAVIYALIRAVENWEIIQANQAAATLMMHLPMTFFAAYCCLTLIKRAPKFCGMMLVFGWVNAFLV